MSAPRPNQGIAPNSFNIPKKVMITEPGDTKIFILDHHYHNCNDNKVYVCESLLRFSDKCQ